MSSAVVTIGPGDQGKRMALEDFEHVQVEEGYLYELGRGVVVVSDVPGRTHFNQLECIRDQLRDYKRARPDRVRYVLGGGECKVLIPESESERHPDLAIYLSEPPQDEERLWALWIPDVAVEIVSESSEQRDYVEKREEYLSVGLREYWIIDAAKDAMIALRRAGEAWAERVVRPPQAYKTRLLPGFALDLEAVFAAAEAGD